jgi:hypothetical protein
VAWTLPWFTARAVTNIVLSTDNLKQKIDEAAPGDVMVVQNGAYAGAVNINKPLSFVRSGTNELRLLGPVTVLSAGAVAFLKMAFSDAVLAHGGANLLLQHCTLDRTLGVNGGRVTIKRATVAQRINLTNVDFYGFRLTNSTWGSS